jgi:hypothetical protein
LNCRRREVYDPFADQVGGTSQRRWSVSRPLVLMTALALLMMVAGGEVVLAATNVVIVVCKEGEATHDNQTVVDQASPPLNLLPAACSPPQEADCSACLEAVGEDLKCKVSKVIGQAAGGDRMWFLLACK